MDIYSEHHTSSISISKSALKNNIQFIKEKVCGDALLSLVVKGNAYGHGIEEFVPLAQSFGVNRFSVFSAHEAFRVMSVKKGAIHLIIMGMIENEQLEWAISNDIEIYIFEKDRLLSVTSVAKKLNKKAIIHIEVETGMNRTGFDQKELNEVAQIIKLNEEHLQIEGLCTHYAGAESVSNYLRIQNQIKKFNSIYSYFCDQGIKPTLRHTACSAAAVNYPETLMDMVRIGILTYGFWPSRETFIQYLKNNGLRGDDPLRRVITWKSKVLSIKHVKRGEFVGYGTSFMTSRDMRIAAVPVGYGYGYSRNLSNQGRVLVHGKRAGVIGIVNMNMMIIDINDISDVKKGDEVILIGKQKNLSISVTAFGELSNQPNYELLTRLPKDLPRIITR